MIGLDFNHILDVLGWTTEVLHIPLQQNEGMLHDAARNNYLFPWLRQHGAGGIETNLSDYVVLQRVTHPEEWGVQEALAVQVVAQIGTQLSREQTQERQVDLRESPLLAHSTEELVADSNGQHGFSFVLEQVLVELSNRLGLLLARELGFNKPRRERSCDTRDEEGAADQVEFSKHRLPAVGRLVWTCAGKH